MNRATAQAKVDQAFDAHLEHLVEILMQNAAGEPDKLQTFVGNFHRGMAMADSAHISISKDLETIFPE